MLRDVIGQEALLLGLQALAHQFADQSITLVDLQRALQKASGRNLDRFFQQWLFRTGAPDLVLNFTTRATERGFLTSGTVLQAGEAYDLDVDLVLATSTSKAIHRLHLQRGVTSFSLASDSKPDWVVLDPEYKVLRWTPQLRHARLIDEARVLLSLGRQAAAVTKLEEYLRRAPDSLDGHAQLGITLEAGSHLGRAEQHFRRVLDYHRSLQVFEPAVSLSQLHLGYVLDLAGRRDAALDAYQRTLALPDEIDTHRAARAAMRTAYVLPELVSAPLRATLLRFAGDYDNGNGIAVSVHVNEHDVLQMGQGAAATSLEWIDAARFRPPGSTSTMIEFSGEPTSTVLILSVGDTVIRLPRKR
jgi:aminopeptidase N